jgi:hypothetical protein
MNKSKNIKKSPVNSNADVFPKDILENSCYGCDKSFESTTRIEDVIMGNDVYWCDECFQKHMEMYNDRIYTEETFSKKKFKVVYVKSTAFEAEVSKAPKKGKKPTIIKSTAFEAEKEPKKVKKPIKTKPAPMEIYIAHQTDDQGEFNSIIGAFSSFEKAKQAIINMLTRVYGEDEDPEDKKEFQKILKKANAKLNGGKQGQELEKEAKEVLGDDSYYSDRAKYVEDRDGYSYRLGEINYVIVKTFVDQENFE